MKHLYSVDITTTVMVLAEDSFQAVNVAKKNMGDIMSDQEIDCIPDKIKSIHGIDSIWEDSKPYGAEKEPNPDLTCAQIWAIHLEREAAEAKEKKDKELEAKLQVNIFSNDLQKAEG